MPRLNNPATGLPSTLTADGSGNLTFTARWIQSTNGAASAPPMSLTGTWLTGGTSTTTKPQFLIEPAGATSNNWSTAGTGLGVNAPSGFTGDLWWAGLDGSRAFSLSASGSVTISNPVSGASELLLRHSNGATGGWQSSSSAQLLFTASGAYGVSIGLNAVNVQSTSSFSWTSGQTNSTTADLSLFRDAADSLAQRRNTNAQTHRIYNTFTNGTNYERVAHTWVSNVCYTRPENAGTGSARLYVPVTGGTTVANLPAAATAGTGARSFATDANATTFLSVVAGGGSNRVPVVSDGTNWLIG